MLILFISPLFPKIEESVHSLRSKYPNALIVGNSSSGEIIGNKIVDESIAILALQFNETTLKLYSVNLPTESSKFFEAGKNLADKIDSENLNHMLVFSDAKTINANCLLKGLNQTLKNQVGITGGLAGRNTSSDSNFVIENGCVTQNKFMVLAMYGKSLKVNYNAKGGWDSFGVERLVTKSSYNKILEVDGAPALEFYKNQLPADVFKNIDKQGFKYPIKVRNEQNSIPLIRALLSVDEKEQSLIMAEEIPEGSYIRIMKGNIDRLIYGAECTSKIISKESSADQQLALLISCAGRRKVMNHLAAEEIEAVMNQFSPTTKSVGFYAYGEVSPFYGEKSTSLHNLTMCVTTFSEL